MAQTFSQQILIADYYAHLDKYVLHCENKSRPMMHCNGRCQLNKKLRQQDNTDKQNREGKSDNFKANPLFSKSFFCNSYYSFYKLLDPQYPELVSAKIDRMPKSFFHPPDFYID